MPSGFGTWTPVDELEEADRTALQRLMDGMGSPVQEQQRRMLSEHLDGLGTPRPAPRGPQDLQAVFDRLGQIGGDLNRRATEGLNRAAEGSGRAAGDMVGDLRAGLQSSIEAQRAMDRTDAETVARERSVAGYPSPAQPGQPYGADDQPYAQERRQGREEGVHGPTLALPVNETAPFTGEPRPGPVEAFQAGVGRTAREFTSGLGRIGENLPAAGAAIVGRRPADVLGSLARTSLGVLEAAGAPLNVPGNIVTEALLQEGVSPQVAEGIGLGLNFATQGGPQAVREVVENAARLAGRAGRVAPAVGRSASEALASLGTSGAFADEALLGARRGQRGIRPLPLTPEELARRERDLTAEQAIFAGVQSLWRQGRTDEADDLRLLAMGKGEGGLGAMRRYLEERGLDVAAPGPEGPVSRLGRSAAEAFGPAGVGARAAETAGERAFDLGAAGVGAAAGAFGPGTEDLTPQERIGRGLAGAALAAPAGASLRALGRMGPRTWGETADVLTSAPLLRPTSLLTNAVGGFFRTAQRWAEETGGAFAVDHALRESVADFLGMAAEVPAALRNLPRSVREGGSPATRRQLGAGAEEAESLVTRPGLRAGIATAGTRLNVATDEFWRQINAAGAQARAAARGITDPNDLAAAAAGGADFASFAGKASRLADFLGGFRRVLTDPNASGEAKAGAAFMVALTPYVKTPERILLATGRLLGDPATMLASVGRKNGLVREAIAGDHEARREVAGRLLVSGLTWGTAVAAYYEGQLWGAPPRDAELRRRLEAEGAQWGTMLGVPLRDMGTFGQAMGGIATALSGARRAYEEGADGSDVVRAFFNEAGRWALDESYLRGLNDFGTALGEGRGAPFVEEQAASAVTRPLSGLAGYVDPFDPYERERRGTEAAVRGGLPGGRMTLPARIDPATGEPVRREGTGLERLLFGSRGVAESPEGRELARLGVTAPEFRPQDAYAGSVQTPEARRALQETFGRYTRDYVRDAMRRPDYAAATDEQKAATLERQVRLARTFADLEVGDRVARDPQARYELEWLRTPHYRGVEGTPDQIARRNLEIREAKALLSEYRQRYGGRAGDVRLLEEDEAAYLLARTPELPERYRAAERERVRRETGYAPPAVRALPGAGNRPVSGAGAPFTAP